MDVKVHGLIHASCYGMRTTGLVAIAVLSLSACADSPAWFDRDVAGSYAFSERYPDELDGALAALGLKPDAKSRAIAGATRNDEDIAAACGGKPTKWGIAGCFRFKAGRPLIVINKYVRDETLTAVHESFHYALWARDGSWDADHTDAAVWESGGLVDQVVAQLEHM